MNKIEKMLEETIKILEDNGFCCKDDEHVCEAWKKQNEWMIQHSEVEAGLRDNTDLTLQEIKEKYPTQCYECWKTYLEEKIEADKAE